MKRVKTYREEKGIIFLGAGAAKQDGAPIQKELIKDFVEIYKNPPDEIRFGNRTITRNEIIPIFERLSVLFNEIFGIDLGNKNFVTEEYPTFEEVLGIIDLADSKQMKFLEIGIPSLRKTISKVREDLIFLIGITLWKKLLHPKGYHSKLIDVLNQQNFLRNTAFFTTNYDILIDNALLSFAGNNPLIPDYRKFIDYGFDIFDLETQRLISKNFREKISVYKLHGSLNWLYCDKCKKTFVSYFKDKRALSSLVFQEHCVCGSTTRPVVIPPAFFKIIDSKCLKDTWKNALKYIQSASWIVFCGYSFQDADLHIKNLFKIAELNNPNFDPTIYLVNKNPDNPKSMSQEDIYNRTRRFFNKKTNIIKTDLSFGDFCKGGIQILSKYESKNIKK